MLTAANAANVARQASIIGILGVGMTFVILTAGIDLSVGSMLGFAAIVFAMTMSSGVAWPLAVLVALVAGAGAGAVNGLGITRGRLQPFVMTLGMLVIARGVTMTISNGKPIPLGEAAASAPCAPNQTSRAAPSSATILIMTSALRAASAGVSAMRAPFSAWGSPLERVRL